MIKIFLMTYCLALLFQTNAFSNTYPNDLSWQKVTNVSKDANDAFSNSVPYPKCSSNSDCDSSFIKQSCFMCPEGKIVFSKGCQLSAGIVQASQGQGICVQEHMSGMDSLYDAFYSGECMPSAAFCLINVAGDDVPTSEPQNVRNLYPLWKN